MEEYEARETLISCGGTGTNDGLNQCDTSFSTVIRLQTCA